MASPATLALNRMWREEAASEAAPEAPSAPEPSRRYTEEPRGRLLLTLERRPAAAWGPFLVSPAHCTAASHHRRTRDMSTLVSVM